VPAADPQRPKRDPHPVALWLPLSPLGPSSSACRLSPREGRDQ